MAADSENRHDGFDVYRTVKTLELCLETRPDGIDLPYCIQAYEELCKIFPALGALFRFVAEILKERCHIVRNLIRASPDKYATVQGMIEYEIRNDVPRSLHKNGTLAMQDLHRFALFLLKFLERFHRAGEEVSLRKDAQEVFEETLAPYQPWVIRKAAALAMYALPNRKNMLKIIAGESEERQHDFLANMGPRAMKRLREVYDKVEAIRDGSDVESFLSR